MSNIEIGQSLGHIYFAFDGFNKAVSEVTAEVAAVLTKVGNLKRTYESQSVVDATNGEDVKYNTKMSVDDITAEFVLGKGSDLVAIEKAFAESAHCTVKMSNKFSSYLINCQISSVEEVTVDAGATNTYTVTLSVSGKPTITRNFAA